MKKKLHYAFGPKEKNILDLGDKEFFNLNYEKALEIYSEAIKDYPGSYLAHECIGVVQSKLGMLAYAESSFKKSIELNINYSSAHNNLGMVYAFQNRLNLAKDEMKLALVLEPDNIEFNKNLSHLQRVIEGMHEVELTYKSAFVIESEIPVCRSTSQDNCNIPKGKTRQVKIFNYDPSYKSGYIVSRQKKISSSASKSMSQILFDKNLDQKTDNKDGVKHKDKTSDFTLTNGIGLINQNATDFPTSPVIIANEELSSRNKEIREPIVLGCDPEEFTPRPEEDFYKENPSIDLLGKEDFSLLESYTRSDC